ncbi:MAG: hypothetical protein GEU77_18800 [Deltaproteobacteria bacterium]|nr:hypothetical protein [Deltaproteobacteria bacterium]
MNKISSDFNSFLGSDADAVVSGLRNGTAINLTSSATIPNTTPASPPVTTTTTIVPPTGKMGFGNVYTSLAVAKEQLAQLGINQPTPQELQAALTGGTVTTGTETTTLQGVLTMRSQNMGWGQIAQKSGFKLGPVISSMKSANKNITNATAATSKGGVVNAGGQSSRSSHSGIVNGSGKIHGGNAKGNGGSGSGIVTGAGKSASGSGHGYGQSRGIVTGAGQPHSAGAGIVSAGRRGNSGNSKGHNK